MNIQQQFDQASQYHQSGQLKEAETIYKKIIEVQPGHIEALHRLAVVYAQEGKFDLALSFFSKALSLKPDSAEVHYNCAQVCKLRGNPAKAAESFRQAIRFKPDYVEAYLSLGEVLKEMRRLSEALENYRKAVSLTPDFHEAHRCLGSALKELGRFDEAAESYDRAVSLNPNFPDIYINIGNLERLKGNIDKAAECYRKALSLKPDDALAHLCLAIVLLLRGDFPNGWKAYQWRWESVPLRSTKRKFPVPQWDGSPLNGKRILLYSEQGMGDTIHFIRYVSSVKRLGGKIIVQCEKELIKLFSRIPEIGLLISKEQVPPAFDVHCPLLSLPYLFGTTADTIPANLPYLSASPECLGKWRQRFKDIREMKIGLVWAGGYRHPEDHYRSIPLPLLRPLVAVPNTRFFSLQVGQRAADLKQCGFGEKVVDLSPELNDFSETAAVISLLDLVISVDTAAAHLAGALARPVRLLLPFAPDWRWLLHREDSLWYPKVMRLFRQDCLGQWEPVIKRVAAELHLLATGENEAANISRCKCCGGKALRFGAVDVSKTCLDEKRKVFPDRGMSAEYFRCETCGFLFTNFIDDWSFERVRKEIYNEEYLLADPDVSERRPAANAELIHRLFGAHKHRLKILDYGGGDGNLARRLSALGFKHVVSFDPFYDSASLKPGGKFNLVLAFEVAEHTSQPDMFFQEIVSFLDAEGIFLFSTLLQPENIAEIGISWWYAAPRNGHVSLYTRRSLEILSEKYRLNYVSLNENFHCAFKHIPAFAETLLNSSRKPQPLIKNFSLPRKAIVISHERSGTHFLMNTLALNFDYISQPWINFDFDLGLNFHAPQALLAFFKTMQDKPVSNIVKSHHHFDFFSGIADALAEQFHIFYVYRDPRDVMVSFWRIIQKLPWDEGPKTETVGEFMRAEPRGGNLRYQKEQSPTMLHRWQHHVTSWADFANAQGNTRKVMLIRYEDLNLKFEETVRDIGARIGRPVMKTPLLPDLRNNVVMPGKGEVGAHRELFTREDHEFVRDIAGETMARLGYGL
jgi:tetratricopeptide (TPR) repeat protein/SAM-dependent methyltransferase